MKNAYVVEDHFGDNGSVTEGMIIVDMPTKRFEALVKSGLVREATAKEVEEGYKPTIPTDESAGLDKVDGKIDLDDPANATARRVAEDAQKFIDNLRGEHATALETETARADAAEKALAAANEEIETLKAAADDHGTALAAAHKEVDELKAKQAKIPANKQAAAPANKSA